MQNTPNIANTETNISINSWYSNNMYFKCPKTKER